MGDDLKGFSDFSLFTYGYFEFPTFSNLKVAEGVVFVELYFKFFLEEILNANVSSHVVFNYVIVSSSISFYC